MGERNGIHKVLGGHLRKEHHLEDRGVDGRIILKWICVKWKGGVGRIDLAEDKDRWLAVVSAVMNLRIS
jgi:hypothetical protein